MFKKNNLKIINADCMDIIKGYEDNYFDLAIVDPPYGIGINKMTLGNGKKKIYRGQNNWDDKIPNIEYFIELKRVSKNQIIWGGNYFANLLDNSRCWLFWDKGTGENDFADGELAWTSFDKVVKKIAISWVGANAKEKMDQYRIHPTQKSVKLYTWLLNNYSEKDFKILDTHLGSGSSAIAAFYFGCKEFVGIEIDENYYINSIKRIKEQTVQIKLL